MLFSFPRVRRVVEISYGCIGRSARQPRTARASGLPTRRRVMPSPPRILELEYVVLLGGGQAISRCIREAGEALGGGPEWEPPLTPTSGALVPVTLTEVRSTERFVGTPEAPRQVLHVTIERSTRDGEIRLEVEGAEPSGSVVALPVSGGLTVAAGERSVRVDV